jgi:hypothetical protein
VLDYWVASAVRRSVTEDTLVFEFRDQTVLAATTDGIWLQTRGFFRNREEHWPRSRIDNVTVGKTHHGGRPYLLIVRNPPCADAILGGIDRDVLVKIAEALRAKLGLPQGD